MTLITVRAIIVAHLECHVPDVFEKVFKNGQSFLFHCTDTFVRHFLRTELNWSWRRMTRAAQKVPEDAERKCYEAALRIAWIIKEEDIPAALFINSDQTGVVYAQGSNITWAQTNSKQVSVVGGEEKRAFTLVTSVCANGELLPFQAVYKGKSTASLPDIGSVGMKESLTAGMVFSVSGTETHWSTHETMHEFVNKIISPFFEQKKKELGLPPEQKSLWYIDCWSVHRSKDFRDWMAANHKNIVLVFVPANCTGMFQPCNVGIQRPLKLSLKRTAHEDIVKEILGHLDKEMTSPDGVLLSKSLPVLRNRSTRWINEAFHALNIPALVKQVHLMVYVFLLQFC